MSKRFTMDGLEEALLGTGRRGRVTNLRVSGSLLYAKGGLFSRVVDAPADMAMSTGIKIKGDDGTIEAELDRLDVAGQAAIALKWSRLTGGAAFLLYADDSASMQAELNLSKLNLVDEIVALDATCINKFGAPYSDASKSNYGMPEFYEIKRNSATFVVHESRLIFLPGDLLPEDLKNGLWWMGRNAVDEAYGTILEYCRAIVTMLGILDRKQQAIYSMDGLADLMGSDVVDGEALVQKRIGLVDATRGVINTVAVDASDNFVVADLSLSGIPDVIKELQFKINAETGIPMIVFFGRSPNGLSANGDAEFQGYYDMIGGIRKNKAQPALERLLTILYAQKGIKAPEDWRIEWEPLERPSAKELAEMDKMKADRFKTIMETIEKALDTSILDQEQAQAFMAMIQMFGLQEGGDAKPKQAAKAA